MIIGNVVGGIIKPPDTIILVDENGNEYTAVSTEEEVDLDATANDIRLGSVAATDTGVTVGEKVIPTHYASEGVRLIPVGSAITVPNTITEIDSYDYTKLQSIICSFNSSISKSVAAEKVSIGDAVYDVQSTDSISTINKNHDSKLIELGITNETDEPFVLRYFMYKEIT